MGQCLEGCCQDHTQEIEINYSSRSPDSPVLRSNDMLCLSHILPPSEAEKMKRLFPHAKNWILDVLHVLETSIESDQPTNSMMRLEEIANNPNGWFLVLFALTEVVPEDAPLGPALISLVLESCPLPAKESIAKVPELFWLSAKRSKRGRIEKIRQRNIAVVLGSLAERLAGPNSVILLTERTLEYLVANLDEQNDPSVILFSLIALEKFAKTSDNLSIIKKYLKRSSLNPLIQLEKWRNRIWTQTDTVPRQVGFCAEWCLDNLFVPEDRVYTYLRTDVTKINAMLNANDVSEYLKISPGGLEARSDVVSFESARCTFPVSEGSWFYEVEILTAGIMQIGWATKEAKFLNHDGYGIGDDEHSIAFDGFRKLIWYDATPTNHSLQSWKPGDVVGCFLDYENQLMIFGLNGTWLPPVSLFFNRPRLEIFAAASLMSFQQTTFNFGHTKFAYPPEDRAFRTFNEAGTLKPNEKAILPRPVKLEMIRKASVHEDSCSLCCERLGAVRLLPCAHGGFCGPCADQLDTCPLCRREITLREHQPEGAKPSNSEPGES